MAPFFKENGQTPLHIVAAEGQENMLRIFYNLKADANIPDKVAYNFHKCT